MNLPANSCPACTPNSANADSVVRHAQLKAWFRDDRLEALIELRVSQIYGCAACVAQHRSQAEEFGEKVPRLEALVEWRELDAFTAREKAALAWAEALTLSAQTDIPEEIFAELAQHFSADEVAQLRVLVNRLPL